jgi:ABC-2 type transport system permease protein
VNGAASLAPSRVAVVLGELTKLPAFLRRDFLVAVSYRTMFFSDAFRLLIQAFLFYFVGLLVDPSKLPTFGGSPVSYMEFVAIGLALAAFVQVALGRVAGAIRREQLAGTLESLMMTPTSTATMQLGSVAYDLAYIPLRTALFLVAVAIGFGLEFDLSGLAPAAVVVLFFIPFVWGLGIAGAAAILTFRGGQSGVGFGVTLLTLASGAYFPLELLPHWVSSFAEYNPMAIAIDGMRDAMLGGTGWSGVGRALLLLTPASILSLGLGILAFRAASERERRRGTLGLY